MRHQLHQQEKQHHRGIANVATFELEYSIIETAKANDINP